MHIFPNDAGIIRLVGAILTDIHDERVVDGGATAWFDAPSVTTGDTSAASWLLPEP